MRVIALVALVDGMQGAGTGILQGMGRPRVSANANLVSYWLIWLPLGGLFTYLTRDIVILWSSLFMAVASAALLINVYILRADWIQIVQEAESRAAEDAARMATAGEGSTGSSV